MKTNQKQKSSLSDKISRSIDAMVGIFSPKKAYIRQAYRKANSMLAAYRGSRSDRTHGDWLTTGASADQAILRELPALRDRSRDLVRNDAYASGIINTIDTNTVGSGIRPQSRVNAEAVGVSPEEAVAFQVKAELIWARWIKFCDAGERMDFYEVQSLVDRQVLENGEAFLLPLMLNRKARPYALAYDIIEADRIQTPFNLLSDKSVRSGIKIGERGQPLAYYVRETHPGDFLFHPQDKAKRFRIYKAKNERTGRKNILHLYPILRPGQTRGVPFFAPVLNYFKHLAQYLEAELVTARIAACFSLFIKSQDPESALNATPGGINDDDQKINEIEPGLIEYLRPGEDVVSFNPSRPGVSFEPFTFQILRMIAASLNLPYELVAKDFTKSNYSNARAALLQAYRYFRCRQRWMDAKLNNPTWEMLIEEAVLRGELRAPGFFERKPEWLKVRWVADGWEWIDPLKEVKAAIEGKDANIINLSDIAASRGQDWEEVLEQAAREKVKIKQLEEKFGVEFTRSDKPKPTDETKDTDDEDRREAEQTATK